MSYVPSMDSYSPYLICGVGSLSTSERWFTVWGYTLSSLGSIGGTVVTEGARVRIPAGRTIKLRVYNGSVDIPFGQTGVFKLYASTLFSSGFTAVDTINWANGAGTNSFRTGINYSVGSTPTWVAVSGVNSSGATGGGWQVQILDSIAP